MGLACLGLSIITRILVSGLWDGPGMPGPVYYNPNPCLLSLGWAWHAWACLLLPESWCLVSGMGLACLGLPGVAWRPTQAGGAGRGAELNIIDHDTFPQRDQRRGGGEGEEGGGESSTCPPFFSVSSIFSSRLLLNVPISYLLCTVTDHTWLLNSSIILVCHPRLFPRFLKSLLRLF
jgi:hypothetical protein